VPRFLFLLLDRRLGARERYFAFNLAPWNFRADDLQPVTDGMKILFPLLIEYKFKRALVLGTCSYPAIEDKGAFKWKVSIALTKIIGGSAYQEFNGLGSFVASQDVN
jgi:hypothetical protein